MTTTLSLRSRFASFAKSIYSSTFALLVIFTPYSVSAAILPGLFDPGCAPGTAGCDIATPATITTGTTAAGSIIIGNASGTYSVLTPGINGNVLVLAGGLPTWGTASGGAVLTVTAAGLTYSSSTGVLSLTAGYNIPLSASTTEWANFFTTPSSRITAGGGLSWTGNTLSLGAGAIPLASATNDGLVSTTTQTFAGNKTLTGSTVLASTTLAGTLGITGATTLTGALAQSGGAVGLASTTINGTLNAGATTLSSALNLTALTGGLLVTNGSGLVSTTSIGSLIAQTMSWSGNTLTSTVNGASTTTQIAIANGTTDGLVSTTSQTFAGNKTLTGSTILATTTTGELTSAKITVTGSATLASTSASMLTASTLNLGSLSGILFGTAGSVGTTSLTALSSNTISLTGNTLSSVVNGVTSTVALLYAGTSQDGLVSTTSQTFAGNKTLTGSTVLASTTLTGTLGITGASTLTGALSQSGGTASFASTSITGTLSAGATTLSTSLNLSALTGGLLVTNGSGLVSTTSIASLVAQTMSWSGNTLTSTINGVSTTTQIALANGTTDGLVSTTSQTFAGDKTLSGTTTFGKIRWNAAYNNAGELPDASTYHGMFAHRHDTNYFYGSHNGIWLRIINETQDGDALITRNLSVVGGTTTLSTTTISELNVSTNGITIANIVPSATSGRLYRQGNGLYWNGDLLGTAGAGLQSLNGLTGNTQTIVATTTGADFGISSSGSTHTFAFPDAGASARGLVSTATQTIAGNKTLTGSTTLASTTLTGTLGITGASTLTGALSQSGGTANLASTTITGTLNAGATTLSTSLNLSALTGGLLVTNGSGLVSTTSIGSLIAQTMSWSGNTLTSTVSGVSTTTQIALANGTTDGLVSTTSQTFAGNKTLTGSTVLASTTLTGTLGITGASTLTGALTQSGGAAILASTTINGTLSAGATTLGSSLNLSALTGGLLITNGSGLVATTSIGSLIAQTMSWSGNTLTSVINGVATTTQFAYAGASTDGLVSTTTQTFAGVKTFSGGALYVSHVSSSGLIGLASGGTRMRLTAGVSDTANNDQGASVDLHTLGGGGSLDLVAGRGGEITFWTSTSTQGAQMRASFATSGLLTLGNGLVVAGNTALSVLSVGGATNLNGLVTLGTTTVSQLSASLGLVLAPGGAATTTNALYNNAGTLSWNGAPVGGGPTAVTDWASSTAVQINEVRRAIATVGSLTKNQLIRSLSVRTTGASFNTAESLNWIALDGEEFVKGVTFVPPMVNNTTPAPIILTGSSLLSGTYAPALSGDSNTNTTFNSNGNGNLTINLGAGNTARVFSYSLKGTPTSETDRTVRDFTLQGSADGSSWTVLDTQSGLTWTTNQEREFTLSVPSPAFQYYRIVWTANNGAGFNGTYTYISSLNLYEAMKAPGNTSLSKLSAGSVILSSSTPLITSSALYNQGGVLYWDGAALNNLWVSNGSSISNKNLGGIGIGITTPRTQLEVAGLTSAPSVIMTSDSAPSPYVSSASSIYNGSSLAYNAFDGNDGTSWLVAGGNSANSWVKLDYSTPVHVDTVRTAARTGIDNPTSWRIEGSNNDSAWTTLYSSTTPMSATPFTFTFTNGSAYRYYREFNVTANGTVGLAMLELSSSRTAYTAAYLNGSVTITGLTTLSGLSTLSTTTVSQLTASLGVVLSSSTPATTTNALYNQGGTLYWNGSTVGGATTWLTSASNIYYNSGNVAIGTSTPSATTRLLIQGAIATTTMNPGLDAGSGTVSYVGGDTVVTYTTTGTTTFTPPTGVTSVRYLVVAGGGAGGNITGGGGGAGGLLTGSLQVSGVTTVVVGAGGVGSTTNRGGNGENSVLGSVLSYGGGGGGKSTADAFAIGGNGGSGGGASYNNTTIYSTGVVGQGHAGGVNGDWGYGTGGGGGAGGVGLNADGTGKRAGDGGPGLYSDITGSSTPYAGGGGGGQGGAGVYPGRGGVGGGGSGCNAGAPGSPGGVGSANTGGGGGGSCGNNTSAGASGGSGIVVIRFTTAASAAPSISALLRVIDTGSATSSVLAFFEGSSGKGCIIAGQSGVSCSSDRTLKKHITPLGSITEKLFSLVPVAYDWKNNESDMEDDPGVIGNEVGFIAQDVERVFPNLVSLDPNGKRTLSYDRFAPLLVAAMKEQLGGLSGLKVTATSSPEEFFANNDSLAVVDVVSAVGNASIVQQLRDRVGDGIRIMKNIVAERISAVVITAKNIFAEKYCGIANNGNTYCLTGEDIMRLGGVMSSMAITTQSALNSDGGTGSSTLPQDGGSSGDSLGSSEVPVAVEPVAPESQPETAGDTTPAESSQ